MGKLAENKSQIIIIVKMVKKEQQRLEYKIKKKVKIQMRRTQT